MKFKENENLDKSLWNTKETVLSIKFASFQWFPENVEKWLRQMDFRRRTETVQNTAKLRSARILRTVLDIWGDLLPFGFQWRPSVRWKLAKNTGVYIYSCCHLVFKQWYFRKIFHLLHCLHWSLGNVIVWKTNHQQIVCADEDSWHVKQWTREINLVGASICQFSAIL